MSFSPDGNPSRTFEDEDEHEYDDREYPNPPRFRQFARGRLGFRRTLIGEELNIRRLTRFGGSAGRSEW
jgi:hypothetical protein